MSNPSTPAGQHAVCTKVKAPNKRAEQRLKVKSAKTSSMKRQRNHYAAKASCIEVQRRAAQAAGVIAADTAVANSAPNGSKAGAKRLTLSKRTGQRVKAQCVQTVCNNPKQQREAALRNGRQQQRSDALAKRRAAALHAAHAQASTDQQPDSTDGGAEAEACSDVERQARLMLQAPLPAHKAAPKVGGAAAKRPALSKRTGKHAKAQWQGTVSEKQKAKRVDALYAGRTQQRGDTRAKRHAAALEAAAPVASATQQNHSAADANAAAAADAGDAAQLHSTSSKRAAKRSCGDLHMRAPSCACKRAKKLHCAVLADQTQAALSAERAPDTANVQQAGCGSSVHCKAADLPSPAAAAETLQRDNTQPGDYAASRSREQQPACKAPLSGADGKHRAAECDKRVSHNWAQKHFQSNENQVSAQQVHSVPKQRHRTHGQPAGALPPGLKRQYEAIAATLFQKRVAMMQCCHLRRRRGRRKCFHTLLTPTQYDWTR